MTVSTIAGNRAAGHWTRLRAVLASTAVVGFLGIAAAAPFTTTSASADEEYAQFTQRIHQEFVPVDAAEPAMDLSVSPYAQIVVEKPEEAPTPAPGDPGAPPAAPAPRYTGGGSPADWMAAAGIPEKDWGYVDYVVNRESGWNPNATNASSGACGLVQALPCSKVPGNGYDPVDNLRWADGYAKGRYGSWKGAYDFWVANNWW